MSSRISRAIQIYGVLTDGRGRALPHALVEFWYVDSDHVTPKTGGSSVIDGFEVSPGGRAVSDRGGRYSLTTDAPGRAPESCPFVIVTVCVRGFVKPLITRAYFPGCHLSQDPLLRRLPAERRRTLIAIREKNGLRFDIRLRNDQTTAAVFSSSPKAGSSNRQELRQVSRGGTQRSSTELKLTRRPHSVIK